MSRNDMASLISTSGRSPLGSTLQAIGASWSQKLKERLHSVGTSGYLALWVALPIFQLTMTGLIYRGRHPELVAYSVVGIAAANFLMNAQYYIGEILDVERIRGTLVALFLAPCPRIAWLTGFALAGLLETVAAVLTTILFGAWVFGVAFDPNYLTLFVTLVLFLMSLWGLGFIFSAIGLVTRRGNDLSNLVSPFLLLLGGVYYPVSLLPQWLRVPAEALPLGYGMQALASASLHHATIASSAADLLPLLGFALVLPVLGIKTFAWLERGVRERGELDLY